MPLNTRQHDLPLSLNPQACFEDKGARSLHHGFPLPELGKGLYTAQFQAPPTFQSLLCGNDKDFFGKRFSQTEMRSWCAAVAATTTTTTPLHGGIESSQRRFLIFDHSGDQTRLLQCPFPQGLPPLTAAEPAKISVLHGLEKAIEEDRVDENGKESEMHEDTDEINALLYSDDDDDDYDDDDDDCESDDEVMSTGHSPYPICNKRELQGIDSPCKKQKLLDKASSLVVGTTKLPESNLTGSGLTDEELSRKDKIRTALKILESVVPGAKGNEALSLLDEAIEYLKLLKRDLISTEIRKDQL